MLPILTFLAVTVTFRPAAPTVGDPIAIEFRTPVTLDASNAYEVLAHDRNHVVLRTFSPKPLVLSGVAEGVRFRNLVIPVRSVLKPKDDLKPAPLAPPRPVPVPRAAWIALGVAAAAAAAIWTALWLRSRRAKTLVLPATPPDEGFRRTVAALLAQRRAHRWALLADATRRYLAATRPHLGVELTTAELLPLLAPDEEVVSDVLHQGDLEKFSPGGAAPLDFETIARRALELIPPQSAAAEGEAA